jgi:nicotinamide-nucleotide amidase
MPSDADALAADILKKAQKRGMTIVTAESCTGGLLAAAFMRAPGASKNFHGGIVAYTKEAKKAMLGVPRDLLESKGAVNEEVAVALAKGALARSPATVSVAITGVAGPEPDEDGNPVGLVYCAVAQRGESLRYRALRLECASQERDAILQEAMMRALTLLSSFCFEQERV